MLECSVGYASCGCASSGGCVTACKATPECASGYVCDVPTGTCTVEAACDGDHTVIDANRKQTDCTPLKCKKSTCLSKCESAVDCVSGFLCESSSGRCVALAPPSEDKGGCTVAASTHTDAAWPLAALALLRAL